MTKLLVAFPSIAYAPKNVSFFCHLCKSQFANFSSLCRHSSGEFLNKVTNSWQPISSPGKILRSVSFNLRNGTKSGFFLFYCEDSLIDMPDLSRRGTKMENSRLWTVQIASRFTEIRHTVSESQFENLIFAILEAVTVTLVVYWLVNLYSLLVYIEHNGDESPIKIVTVTVDKDASFLRWHRFGY
jgi:hypothetical protein